MTHRFIGVLRLVRNMSKIFSCIFFFFFFTNQDFFSLVRLIVCHNISFDVFLWKSWCAVYLTFYISLLYFSFIFIFTFYIFISILEFYFIFLYFFNVIFGVRFHCIPHFFYISTCVKFDYLRCKSAKWNLSWLVSPT